MRNVKATLANIKPSRLFARFCSGVIVNPV
jgi:hypothetical protein